ncbi:GtrA family protein [Parafrankia sp. BMG5.11]|uniref:GtrA family protein n=1 Tax=Parafrankia sp. BMG5.11 TaxID=222540 RepID=UPI00103E0341|nr:hypothetical protein E0504_40995 [Parafrankia sp. BMG5.11]
MFTPKIKAIAGQVLRFGISTGFSAALSFGLPLILHEYLGLTEPAAVAIGFAIAYAGNIWLLRNFVFRSTADWWGEVFRYMAINAAFRLIEYGAFFFLFKTAGLDYRIALLAVLGVSAVLKFFLYREVFSGRQGSAAA